MANNQVQLSERDKYVKNLEEKIRKAGKAKRFLDNEDGSIVTEFLQQEINTLVKDIGGTKYLNDHQGYVYKLGQLNLAQKLLNMLNSNAAVDTMPLAERVKETKEEASA